MSNSVTFIDLFAGAGGFSEGLLQSRFEGLKFEFLLASDINENCELTHRARYERQLGLPARFLRKSITDEDFVERLEAELAGRAVDVVCGGPPCQSFSLAGRRRKFDKKDNLFAAYLEVIRRLRPKYFVMENVLGILTKEGGAFRNQILEGIASIVDPAEMAPLLSFVAKLRGGMESDPVGGELQALHERLEVEVHEGAKRDSAEVSLVESIERSFKKVCSAHLDYHQSKTETAVLTVRHGLRLLAHHELVRRLRQDAVMLKSRCDVDQDSFVGDFDQFLAALDRRGIVGKVIGALEELSSNGRAFGELVSRVEWLGKSVAEAMDRLGEIAEAQGHGAEFKDLHRQIQLYRIDKPLVVIASDFGVPQDRRRVLFIGCRRDQPYIDAVRPTVGPDEKVTVFEALADLDFIGNGEEAREYRDVSGEAGKLFRKRGFRQAPRRQADGRPVLRGGKTFAEWCREGRIGPVVGQPVYYSSTEEYDAKRGVGASLHNHKASFHNSLVEERLQAIIDAGGYEKLESGASSSLMSKKRDYNLLNPEGQSPTVVTLPDDFVHYARARAPTVRELARLQSFDDSFVFQGKRTTGGDRRKDEVPQYTLVGNAVPPLLARAVGDVLLENIDTSSAESERAEVAEGHTGQGRTRHAG